MEAIVHLNKNKVCGKCGSRVLSNIPMIEYKYKLHGTGSEDRGGETIREYYCVACMPKTYKRLQSID